MTKPFCDICGQPAVKEFQALEASKNLPAGTVIPFHNYTSREVVVRGVFIYRGATTYDAKPDLCAKCGIELLQALVDKAKNVA